MHAMNVVAGGREMGSWSRLIRRVRDEESKPGALWDAVQAMHAEQRAEGMLLQRQRPVSEAPVCCDYSDCGRAATHEWSRSHAEQKKMHRGGKNGVAVMPIVWHCEYHVPSWRTGSYVRLDAQAAQEAKVA